MKTALQPQLRPEVRRRTIPLVTVDNTFSSRHGSDDS